MKNMVSLFIGFFALTLCAMTSFATTELARVNNTVISIEDFNKKFKENLRFFQFKAPTKQGVLDDLIKRELGIQEARHQGLDKDPEVVDRMNTVLYHALLDKKLSKEFETIKITDDEAKDFYTKNPEIRSSHIFVALRPDATPDETKKAQEKIQKIYNDYIKELLREDLSDSKKTSSKMGFAEIAQRFSEGVAAPMGGDIDYQTRDRLDPLYYETAVKLKIPGKISGIIRSQFGFHIIKLTAVKSWEDVDKAQVKRLLFDERRTQVFEHYMDTLRKQAKVTVQADLLKP